MIRLPLTQKINELIIDLIPTRIEAKWESEQDEMELGRTGK